MIDRNDPDIGKRINLANLATGLGGKITTFYSIQHTPIKNPWIELHDGTVRDGLSLANWELKIPQYGCSCKKFYAEWKAENAPDFTSPEAFFAWGVRLHNAVNRKLGKPELTIDEAKKIWRSKDGCSEDSGSNLP